MIFRKSKNLVGSHSRKFRATTEVESIYVPCLTNRLTFFNLLSYLPVSIFSPYRFISPSCPMALIIQVPAGLSLSFLSFCLPLQPNPLLMMLSYIYSQDISSDLFCRYLTQYLHLYLND